MIAVALSPKARALIRANRDLRRPTTADRERVAAALRARLGDTVLPLDTQTSLLMMSTGIQRRFAAAFGLCVVGSALFLARRPDPPLQSTTQSRDKFVEAIPSATPIAPPIPISTQLGPSATPQLETPQSAQPHAQPKVARTQPVPDTLAQELALLTNAASQLSVGQANGALLVLEEHQRRFPRGVLNDERNVAKARALCLLHRFDEGRAALSRLAAGTPAAARVKEECDAAWARASRAELLRERE